MTYKHKNDICDKLLNKRVRIEFKDGEVKCGILRRFGHYLYVSGDIVSFTSSCVKKIKEEK